MWRNSINNTHHKQLIFLKYVLLRRSRSRIYRNPASNNEADLIYPTVYTWSAINQAIK